MRSFPLPLALSLVLASACSDDSTSPTPGADVADDTAMDAPDDVSTDAADDAAPDATPGEDATEDADTPPDELPLNGVVQEIPACAPYAQPGPHVVGHRTFVVGDDIYDVFYPADVDATPAEPRSTYDMREWLPEADREKIPDEAAPFFTLDAWRDLPAATADGDGFPLVLFSHGLAGYRLQSATLLVHLASWGYVVASADHPERYLPRILTRLAPDTNDQTPATTRRMLDDLLARTADPGDPLAGSIDATRVAMSGHSAGGGTTLNVASFEEIDVLIIYAAGNARAVETPPRQPVFLIAGETDGIIPIAGIRAAYDALPAPRGFINIAGAGHLAFSDICVVGRDRGGILAIAAEYGIRVNPLIATLGRDGCNEGDLEAERSWPIIHHASVAHLRSAFGDDAVPVGLGDDLASCFDGLLADSLLEE